MAADCKIVGEALVVTHEKKTLRLPLSPVPIDRLSIWLDLEDGGFWDTHQTIRDQVMPDAAREKLVDIEKIDAVDAAHVAAEWSRALGVRLGKALSVSSSGVTTVQPSPATSGSDTESSSTE